VALGEGWFVTYAGELMYHYSCRPIIVVGRDDEFCYSALPIDLIVEDQKRITKNREDEHTNGTKKQAVGRTKNSTAEKVGFRGKLFCILSARRRRSRRYDTLAKKRTLLIIPEKWLSTA
jgi:hypothetical protein